MRVRESIEIKTPLPEAFDYIVDVGNYPEWMAHAVEVRKDGPGAPKESDEFVVAIKSIGRHFETPYLRTSYEPNRRCTDQSVGGPIPNQRWHSTFQDLPDGTRMTRTVEVGAAGLLRLLAPLQRWAAGRQLKEDLQTLKGVLERRPS